MPSFLNKFLTPLKSQFTKAAQTVQPLFVDKKQINKDNIKSKVVIKKKLPISK